MRGRIDVSEGFPRQPLVHSTPNLIQAISYGEGLSKLTRLQERAPSPTLGSEIVPVLLVDNLLSSGYPPRRRVIASRVSAGAPGLQPTWIGVNCRGALPSGDVNDKLVVHSVQVINAAAGVLELELLIGHTSGVTGLGGGFAESCDSTRDQPAVGAIRSDFTGTLVGESPDATDADAQQFFCPGNDSVRLEGPFVIGQGEAVFVRTIAATASRFCAHFLCEEFGRA